MYDFAVHDRVDSHFGELHALSRGPSRPLEGVQQGELLWADKWSRYGDTVDVVVVEPGNVFAEDGFLTVHFAPQALIVNSLHAHDVVGVKRLDSVKKLGPRDREQQVAQRSPGWSLRHGIADE